mmetsp:Transcript_18315/g.73429  ORF Transcript_18315/g.73429 Transcript_18315/m.73429 type:complete len:102 (+) Transcript_18315:1673-1978(+)
MRWFLDQRRGSGRGQGRGGGSSGSGRGGRGNGRRDANGAGGARGSDRVTSQGSKKPYGYTSASRQHLLVAKFAKTLTAELLLYPFFLDLQQILQAQARVSP